MFGCRARGLRQESTVMKQNLAHWLPGTAQFTGYQRSWLRGDVLAGVTVAAYLVPQVMAYATVAGLPPVAGLWAALVPMGVYALLVPRGSCRSVRNPPRR
jgi:SulP family sulfate permease